MTRPPLIAFLGCLLVLAAAGCGSNSATTTVPIVTKAPPQTAALAWSEPYPVGSPALVFGVSSFSVTRSGWSAEVSVENTSTIAWEIGDPRYPELAFGVLLFPNNDLDELERRNRSNELPAIRAATSFLPGLPDVLEPGQTWEGTISAPGALAGGLWVRLSFGPFVSTETMPEGVTSPVVWFTDHAYHLDEIVAAPS